jgi:hypothetical protein
MRIQGEHEHCHTKACYERTNFRHTKARIVKIDVLQSRFRLIAHELCQHGVVVPGEANTVSQNLLTMMKMTANEHYCIAQESCLDHNGVGLANLLRQHCFDLDSLCNSQETVKNADFKRG